jgi:hypothetical protein
VLPSSIHLYQDYALMCFTTINSQSSLMPTRSFSPSNHDLSSGRFLIHGALVVASLGITQRMRSTNMNLAVYHITRWPTSTIWIWNTRRVRHQILTQPGSWSSIPGHASMQSANFISFYTLPPTMTGESIVLSIEYFCRSCKSYDLQCAPIVQATSLFDLQKGGFIV